MVTASATGDHIIPGVLATLRDWKHVITRQLLVTEMLAAVKAKITVATEECLISQRRDMRGAGHHAPLASDNRVDLNDAGTAVDTRMTPT